MKWIHMSLIAFFMLFLACSAEKSLFKKAQEEKTIEGYEKYLSEYGNGKYAEDARESIQKIKFAQKRDSSFLSLIDQLENEVEQTNACLKISPSSKVLMGTPVRITIDHLPANCEITLHALRKRWGGLVYSFGSYRTSPQGQIRLSDAAPLAGTCSGRDSLGIFWSMSWPAQHKLKLPFDIKDLKSNTIYFYISQNNRVIADTTLELMEKLPDIVTDKIETDSLTVTLHYPKTRQNLPALILVSGGSEQEYEWNNQMMAILASHGYATMAMPYNGVKPLPKYLEEVPLEYFFHAIDWLKKQPMVDANQIVLIGGSRGGELVLLLASLDPDVDGVIAISPSHVIWQGLPHNPLNLISPKAAWTLHGKKLAYLRHYRHWPSIWKMINGGNQIEFMNFHESPLRNEPNAAHAAIKVEKVKGPILLIAGKQDCMWPSYKSCRFIEHRLDSLDFAYPVESLYYEHAGHKVIAPDLLPTIDYDLEGTKFGGTDSGNANAQIDAWNKMMQFLETYFPPDHTNSETTE